MTIKAITESQREQYNKVVSHPLQSYEWGDFREKTGVVVIRRGIFDNDKLVSAFQLTIHKLPFTLFTIGYLPKGEMPTEEIINELRAIGREHHCLFIQLEPNRQKGESEDSIIKKLTLKPSAHPLFTKFTFVLDLTQSEDELLKEMHSKTRYNIKIAQKHGVIVRENNTKEAFKTYLKLTEETSTRQNFYAHSRSYHQKQWETLPHTINNDSLSSHLLEAIYTENGEKKTLTSWMMFIFKNILYYPYGASSNEHREVMASTMMMWSTIKFGKERGLKEFDMWGAATVVDPLPTDPYFGFHQFKQRFGAKHTEFIGSFDLVIHPILYKGFVFINMLRWVFLKLKR